MRPEWKDHSSWSDGSSVGEVTARGISKLGAIRV